MGSANSYTGVCELVYRCLRTRIPVSANSYTGVLNSYTGVCEIVYWGESIPFHKHRYTSSQTPVYEFANTGIRVHRHRYTSSQTPVYEFKTPVYEFADTGIRVQ